MQPYLLRRTHKRKIYYNYGFGEAADMKSRCENGKGFFVGCG